MGERNDQLQQEMFGCKKINPEFCKTCVFRHGEPPFADLPTKAYCMIYSRESGISKPKSVYYEGERCEYYQEETTE